MSGPLFPRKTPQQVRSRATRDAIVEAAARIISERGLDGFSTNAVAERAGVSIGSLYQYFPNKDALMVALIKRQQARQLATLADAIDTLPERVTLAQAVRRLVQAAMQHHREDALLASAIDHEEARLPVDDVLSDAQSDAGVLIGSLFSRFDQAIGQVDAARAARTLPAMVRAIVDVWANLMPSRPDVAEEEAVRAVTGYLNGETQLQ